MEGERYVGVGWDVGGGEPWEGTTVERIWWEGNKVRELGGSGLER